MPQFLTMKEAASRTGKSPSSIRRIIYPILRNDNHPERQHIEPSVDEAKSLRASGQNFPWKISSEFLDRAAVTGASGQNGSDASSSRTVRGAEAELLGMLRRELEIKNQQIEKQSELLSRQMQLIDGLGERLREGNILIGSLQQQLALPEGPIRSNVVDAQAPKSREGGTSLKRSPKPASKPAKPKRGFFLRLFR